MAGEGYFGSVALKLWRTKGRDAWHPLVSVLAERIHIGLFSHRICTATDFPFPILARITTPGPSFAGNWSICNRPFQQYKR
jgi:hypothetical protein